MKHYSAELLENNDVATGGNLEILNARPRGNTAISPGATGSNPANDVDGLVLSGNNFTDILDAQGSAFDPLVADSTENPLAFVRSGVVSLDADDADGTNVIKLFYKSNATTSNNTTSTTTSADYGIDIDVDALVPIRGGKVFGTNLNLYNIDIPSSNSETETQLEPHRLAQVDVTSLIGGGSGSAASTNDTDNILPVKATEGTTRVFDDSLVALTGTGYANAVNLQSADVTGTTIAFTGSSITGFADNDVVIIRYEDPDSSGLLNQRVEGTVSGTPTSTAISIDNISSGTFAAALNDQANFTITKKIEYTGVVVNGDLEVTGTTTTIDSTVVSVADKYFNVAVTDLPASNTTEVSVPGGLLAEANRTSDGSSVTKQFAGLRYNPGMDSSTAGQWEVAVHTQGPDETGAGGTWTALGGVVKYATTISYSASGGGATAQTITANTHNITGNDFEVQVFEYVDSTGDRVNDGNQSDTAYTGTTTPTSKRQVLPEQVSVAFNGDITIVMPDEGVARNFRVVIKG